MAEYHVCTTTKAGLDLIALSRVNQAPIVFTRMAIGDSRPSDTSAIASMTTLVSERLTSDITGLKKIKNTDKAEARYAAFGKFSNDTLSTGMYVSEIGIWAKVESSYYTDESWDGYTGEAVLFAYSYADEGKADWMPDKNTPMTPQEIGIYTSVGDAETVSVHITEQTTVSIAEFNAHLTDVNAHSDFVGCTALADGKRGFVPKPAAGTTPEYYLSADGGWKQVKQRTIKDIIDIIYPVGSIYTTTGDTNPNTQWAGTTWERYAAGRVLMGAGNYVENGTTYTYTNGATGGEAKHQLTIDEIPSHGHSLAFGTNNISFSFSIRSQSNNTANVLPGIDTIVTRKERNSGNAVEPSSAGSWYRDELYYSQNITPSATLGLTGGNGLHENRQPYTVVNFWRRTS